MIQQSKINSFVQSISDVAAAKKNKIDAETKEILTEERKQLEAAAKSEAKEYVRQKSNSVKLEAGRRISASVAECRKAVFESRNEIAEKVMSAAAEKLRAFTGTEEYKTLVFESADKIVSEFETGYVTLLVRPDDIVLQKELCEKYPNVSVTVDETIKIGGIKGIDSTVTLLIDDTLDSRLAGQKKWFEENSGLYISMR